MCLPDEKPTDLLQNLKVEKFKLCWQKKKHVATVFVDTEIYMFLF